MNAEKVIARLHVKKETELRSSMALNGPKNI